MQAKNKARTATGAGAFAGWLFGAGVISSGGLSAAALTHGLATLGLGTMVGGLVVLPALTVGGGIAGYKLYKHFESPPDHIG